MAGLPRSARLRASSDFAPFRHAVGRWQGRYFALRWIGLGHAGARVGLAVSRKVSKRAVVRNRIKRTIRESFRSRRDALPALDILVIARTAAAVAAAVDLRDDLANGWHQLEALKQSAAPGTIGG